MTDQRADDMDFVRAWNEALTECSSLIALAKHFGISNRAMLRRRRRVEARLGITLPSPGSAADAERALMARKGVAPEFDMTHPVAPGFAVKGTSTLYTQAGIAAQWVKTDQDRERMHAAMVAAVEAMAERIPREKPRPAPKHANADLLNCYVITDYHVGSLSWPEETGEPWDTSIAERMLIDWFGAAIAQSPPAESAVLAQLGDFLHYDSLEAITPTSKHLLDADSRFQRVVRVAIRAVRQIIGMLLAKHQHVHVLMAEGNHDMASSVWLRELMAALYENEPRVTVDVSPDPYYCVEHGQTALFFHHGHKRGVKNVDTVFAAKFREVFGRTRYAYAHMGHLHHVDVKETNLMLVEQHQTLAARDAYASRVGWVSDRSAQVITYHRALGEVGRVRIAAAMFEAQAA
jgi:hypothetical protein